MYNLFFTASAFTENVCAFCSQQLTPYYSFHMVKIDDKAYMVSAEVSALLWKEDLIRTKVCSGFSVKSVEI